MNLILGIVVLIAWVVYRTTRPSQFRVIELDGEYYLEIKGWLTGLAIRHGQGATQTQTQQSPSIML